MTDSGNERPRRAAAPEGAAPDGLDDTRRAVPGGARRGAADHFDTPFARPADPDPATAIPAPVLPETERRLDPPAPVGRRSLPSASDAPRRSAPSTTSPTAPGISLPSRARVAEPGNDDGGWFRHHRRTLLVWGSGALAALVLIVIGFYVLANRGRSDEAQPGESTTSELPPVATEANLMTVSDADTVVPDAGWAVVDTIASKKDRRVRPICLGKDVADINPIESLHRTIGADGQLALLHEIDSYATVDAATQIYQKRVADISTCATNQVYIVGATAVAGLGDEAVQVTVASEEETIQYHTILLVRTGRTASTFIAKRTDTPVEATPLVTAAAVRLGEICTASQGTCPTETTVTPSLPPRVEPSGWLISSDLPRITPGFGKWVPIGAPGEVKPNASIGCENMSLDTDPGPTERQQVTFVLNETNQIAVPEGFGLDEMRFTFADEEAATNFEATLVSNITSCKERLTTANVTEFEAVSGVGADEVPVAARMFSVSLDKSDESKAHYQLIVTRAATTVSYVLVTVAPEYQFSEAQLGSVAIRAAQRATQG